MLCRGLRRVRVVVILILCAVSTTRATWVERSVGSVQDWLSIASSSDGVNLAAGVWSGSIWTSDDSGFSWTERTPDNSPKVWQSIASSSDGSKLAAVVNEGSIWTSVDYGVTWTKREVELDSGISNKWYSIASSSDGFVAYV